MEYLHTILGARDRGAPVLELVWPVSSKLPQSPAISEITVERRSALLRRRLG